MNSKNTPFGGEFVFDGYTLNEKNGEIKFHYTQVLTSGESFNFIESLIIKEGFNKNSIPAILLESLHLILGISYYKAFCSKKITLSDMVLDEKQAQFWNTVYTKGLGEFFYLNNIDPRGKVQFPYSKNVKKTGIDNNVNMYGRKQSSKALVLVGGGKDSIVSVEITRRTGIEFDLFSLNTYAVIEDTARIAGKDLHSILRKIDPQILNINDRSDSFNGHIPISAVYSFTALLYAYVNQYSQVIVSNERSSDYGNTEYFGAEISHQWSKSFEYEKLFCEYTQSYITQEIKFFSLLRPIYEIHIAKIFSKLTEYFNVFSSSNHNFKIDAGHNRSSRWNYNSPKTVFVFVILSAFLKKDMLELIFGKNLYEIDVLRNHFADLLGLNNIKPFDCVGTPDETIVAMNLALQSGEYSNDAIIKWFKNEVLPAVEKDIAGLEKVVFAYGDDGNIPSEYTKVLKDVIHETN